MVAQPFRATNTLRQAAAFSESLPVAPEHGIEPALITGGLRKGKEASGIVSLFSVQRESILDQTGAGESAADPARSEEVKAQINSVSFFYGAHQALKAINMPIYKNKVTALIGPSGCGKTTLLRCLNRMHDLYQNIRYEGEIILQPDGTDLIGKEIDPVEARMRIGMVFQKPNPFPKSIFDNVAYGLRLRGERGTAVADRVEAALKDAALWDEVSGRLKESAFTLSGGQQQRLCIARTLAVEPELVLFDEPTSALDPIATSKIEDLTNSLKERVTVLMVTHNMQQAARVADYTGFMYLGELVEFGVTEQIFLKPQHSLTENYVAGRFG